MKSLNEYLISEKLFGKNKQTDNDKPGFITVLYKKNKDIKLDNLMVFKSQESLEEAIKYCKSVFYEYDYDSCEVKTKNSNYHKMTEIEVTCERDLLDDDSAVAEPTESETTEYVGYIYER